MQEAQTRCGNVEIVEEPELHREFTSKQSARASVTLSKEDDVDVDNNGTTRNLEVEDIRGKQELNSMNEDNLAPYCSEVEIKSNFPSSVSTEAIRNDTQRNSDSRDFTTKVSLLAADIEETGGRRKSFRKRYQCTSCSRKFISNEKLLMHLQDCDNEARNTEEESKEDTDCNLSGLSYSHPEARFKELPDGESEEQKTELSGEELIELHSTQHKDDQQELECDSKMIKSEELLEADIDIIPARNLKGRKKHFQHQPIRKAPESKTESESRKAKKKMKKERFRYDGKLFASRAAIERYKLEPSVDVDKLKCQIKGCNLRFPRQGELTRHIKIAHEPKYSCSICKKGTFHIDELLTHQNHVHLKIQLDLENDKSISKLNSAPEPDEVFKCPVSACPESFLNKQNLKGHALLHGEFQCQFCDETKSYAPDLAIHEALSHERQKKLKQKRERLNPESQTYSCPRCEFTECTERNYLQHFLRTHLKLTLMVKSVCCVCKTAIPTKSEYAKKIFLRHYKVHHDLSGREFEEVYRCDKDDLCQAYFLKEDQLIFHKYLFHNEKIEYPCPGCDKVFPDRAHLRKHGGSKHKLLFHIKCPHQGCAFRCEDDSFLKKHLQMVHSKETSNKNLCSECGNTFKCSAVLARHIRTVHGPRSNEPKQKKDFVCSHCGKQFKYQEAVDRHILGVHVGPDGWQFACDMCPKKCLNKHKLAEHIRTHTRETLYACEKCGMGFMYRHTIRRHLKQQHGILNLNDGKGWRKNK